MGHQVHAKIQHNRPSRYRDTAGGTFVTPFRRHAPRAIMGTDMIRHWSHTRQERWGYPPKETACQSSLRFQRYKPLKSVTTAGRPTGRAHTENFSVYQHRWRIIKTSMGVGRIQPPVLGEANLGRGPNLGYPQNWKLHGFNPLFLGWTQIQFWKKNMSLRETSSFGETLVFWRKFCNFEPQNAKK